MYLCHQISFIIKKEKKIIDTHKNLEEAPEDNVE